jgi:hypothetical protein
VIATLFKSKQGTQFPAFLYGLTLDMFAVVEHWDPPSVSAIDRGRLFESFLYRYCAARRLTLTERAGSRTLRGCHAASGFGHESDGVIATPELTVHLELKHLGEELGKNELLVFNQKGLDFLAADDASLRKKPLYRVIVSATKLRPEARRFAVQWGILAVEPDILPLLVIHWLAGRHLKNLSGVSAETQDAIWSEVPHLVAPLQERMSRLCSLLEGSGELIGAHRTDRALNDLQRVAGDYYWMAVEEEQASWLEDRYDWLHRELCLDGLEHWPSRAAL